MNRLLALFFALLVPPMVGPRHRAVWFSTRMTSVTKPGLDAVGAVHDRVERWLAPSWTHPGHARLAAGLFMASLSLAGAGVMAALALSAPVPAAHLRLQRLANVVTRATLPASVAEIAEMAGAAPADTRTEERPPASVASGPDAKADAAAGKVDDAPRPVAIPPASRGALPIGKGM